MAKNILFSFLLLLPCLYFHAHATAQPAAHSTAQPANHSTAQPANHTTGQPAHPTAHPATNNPSPLIATACQNSKIKPFCIHLLTNDRNTAKSDLKGFTFIALRAAEKNATSTSISIKEFLRNIGMDSQPELQQGLSDCSEHYITAVELIEDSVSALVNDEQDDLVKFVNAAMDDIEACNAGLKEGKDVVSREFSMRNFAIRQLLITSLDIAASAVANPKK